MNWNAKQLFSSLQLIALFIGQTLNWKHFWMAEMAVLWHISCPLSPKAIRLLYHNQETYQLIVLWDEVIQTLHIKLTFVQGPWSDEQPEFRCGTLDWAVKEVGVVYAWNIYIYMFIYILGQTLQTFQLFLSDLTGDSAHAVFMSQCTLTVKLWLSPFVIFGPDLVSPKTIAGGVVKTAGQEQDLP